MDHAGTCSNRAAVIIMQSLAQILRYYHVEKWRIGTIARQLHVHHGTVARVLGQAGLPRIGPPAPKHGSWLNLVEGFFSKLARSVLRHIRVASKQELKHRLMAAVEFFNGDPVVHTWTYKLEKAA
jgi:hypothetical protein